jgi:glycosidase
MDAIMNYWQEIGVDGFRCDVSHIIPSEFWHWALARARTRNSNTYFYAECYEGDTRLEVPDANPDLASYHSNPLSLIEAGFSSVYGHDVYKGLMKIYEESGWANDLDSLTRPGFVGDNSLRYAENHDECRVASTQHWGGHGMSVGRVVSTVLFALSRGPVMVYYGQEVGEAATVGAAGFELDKGRTTFFDYWSVPELQKWYHDGSCDGSPLSIEQKELRAFYGRTLQSLTHPALAQGNFYPLNPANKSNSAYGRLPGETTSGHWMYSFLRNDPVNQKSVLVAVNLHPTQTLSGVRCLLSKESATALALPNGATLTGIDLLASSNPATFSAPADTLTTQGMSLPDLPPFSSYYFDLSTQK